MIDRVSEMYWSSHNAKVFVDKMNAYYKGNVQAGRIIAQGFPHFALGFCNGVYGDIAIPLVLAGASGALGPRIKHNIWWACRVMRVAFGAIDFEAEIKLASVYVINNKMIIAGKWAGGLYLNSLYAKLGLKLGLAAIPKALINSACLAIIAFVSHKRLIMSLENNQRIFVFLYVLLSGDSNLLMLNNKRKICEMQNLLSGKINRYSVEEMNKTYQQINAAVPAIKQFMRHIKRL